MKKKLAAGTAMLAIISGAALLAPRPAPQPPAAKAAMRAPVSCRQARRAVQHHLHRVHVGYCYGLPHHPSWHYFGWPSKITAIAYYRDGPYGGVFFRFHRGVW